MKQEPLIKENTYNAPLQKVWKAISEKELLKKWFFDVSDFKAEVGFEFQFKGGNETTTYMHLCKITEVVFEKKISFTWQYDGYEGNSLLTIELFPVDSKTKIKLTHEGLETFPKDNPDFVRENFVEGWTYFIDKALKEFVE